MELISEEDERYESKLEQMIKEIEKIKLRHMAKWKELAAQYLAQTIAGLPARQSKVFTLTYGESPNFEWVLYPRRTLCISGLESRVATKYEVDPCRVIWLPWEVDFVTGDARIQFLLHLLGIELNDKETLFLILDPPIMTAQKAALKLDTSVNNVKVNLTLARQKIRQFFYDSPGP